MKKIIAASTLALALGIIAAPSFAADGKINFTGRVTSATCEINGNGTGGSDFTVALTPVQASSLAAAGQVAGQKDFNIQLSGDGCTATAAKIHFETGATVDPTTGNLKNTIADGASNVQIGLTEQDGTAINVSTNEGSKFVNIAANTATLNYKAQYVATGAATAGEVASNVEYSIAYQ